MPLIMLSVARSVRTSDVSGIQILNVDVCVAHIGNASAVRRELRELQSRWFGIVAAELLERAALDVQHPVVATALDSPHALAVGVDQEARPIVRPGVVVDFERPLFAFRSQRRRGNQNAAFVRRGVIAHDVFRRGQIVAIFVGFRIVFVVAVHRLQHRVAAAIRQPFDRAGGLGLIGFVGKNRLQRERLLRL